MRCLKTLTCLTIFCLVMVSCRQRTPDQAPKDLTASVNCLTIFHTNDHHGYFWPNDKGEGGLPAQATLVQGLRQSAATDGCETLMLSAGDVHMGPLESNMSHAQPDLIGMKHLKYEAMAVGNHISCENRNLGLFGITLRGFEMAAGQEEIQPRI